MSEYVVEEPSDGSASWRVHELIVRCRDCCCFHRLHEDGTGVCVRHGHGAAPNGFCVWGERKEDA